MLLSRQRHGYTLIEMLVVIAIIGVLAGLIFPVAASAKKRAKQTQCMNNMYQIFTALKQFQLDEHRYPEFIAGPVQWKDAQGYHYSGPRDAPLPLNMTTGMVGGTNGGNGRAVSLYPEYINTLNTLKCPMQDLGGERILYTLGPAGNGKYNTKEDPMYPILSGFNKKPFRGEGLAAQGLEPNGSAGQGAFWVYKYSSYDWQCPMSNVSVGDDPPGEAHYSPAWADWDGTMPVPDNLVRQLRWRTPPEDTMVCWCSNHRSIDGTGAPNGGSNDVVLFLDGHVQLRPTTQCMDWTKTWFVVTP